MISAPDFPPTEALWAVRFGDPLAAANFLGRLQEHVTRLGAPAGLMAWIRAPLLGLGGDARCCAYLTAAALRAALEAGLSMLNAEPLAAEDLPVARVLVVGEPG
jgi:hypothetical protein